MFTAKYIQETIRRKTCVKSYFESFQLRVSIRKKQIQYDKVHMYENFEIDNLIQEYTSI